MANSHHVAPALGQDVEMEGPNQIATQYHSRSPRRGDRYQHDILSSRPSRRRMDPNDADDEGEEEEVSDDAPYRIASRDGVDDEVRVIFDGSSTQLIERPE
jgi:hypothetical protein